MCMITTSMSVSFTKHYTNSGRLVKKTGSKFPSTAFSLYDSVTKEDLKSNSKFIAVKWLAFGPLGKLLL